VRGFHGIHAIPESERPFGDIHLGTAIPFMIHPSLQADPSLLAAFQLLPAIGLMIPVACLALSSLLIIVILHYQNRERERWHATVRLALEKGVPIPAMTGSSTPSPEVIREKQRLGFVVGGLVNIAIGIGVFAGLSSLEGASQTRYFGLIPGLIGVALLACGLIFFRKPPTPGDQAPTL
jgi:hypothetical protein